MAKKLDEHRNEDAEDPLENRLKVWKTLEIRFEGIVDPLRRAVNGEEVRPISKKCQGEAATHSENVDIKNGSKVRGVQ